MSASSPALDALHRVALEMGVVTGNLTPAHVGTAICREYHRMRTENIALGNALEQSYHRIGILEGTVL